MILTIQQIRKFEILLEKCNAEEIRARDYAKRLEATLCEEYSQTKFEKHPPRFAGFLHPFPQKSFIFK